MKISEIIIESATAGATASGNIASVVSPQVTIGRDRVKKSYTGSPGKSGTKAPSIPTIKQPKKKNGTAVNALDITTNIFGEDNLIKR